MRKIVSSILVLATVQMVGCASVSNGTSGSLRIETVTAKGAPIEGAVCNLSNDSGTVSVTTPGSVLVHRSSSDLKIDCKKDGEASGRGTAISRVTGSMFGNILLGGGIGMIVDHSNGSAYNYPEWMKIVMGDDLIFDRQDFVSGEPSKSHSLNKQTASIEKPATPEAAEAKN